MASCQANLGWCRDKDFGLSVFISISDRMAPSVPPFQRWAVFLLLLPIWFSLASPYMEWQADQLWYRLICFSRISHAFLLSIWLNSNSLPSFHIHIHTVRDRRLLIRDSLVVISRWILGDTRSSSLFGTNPGGGNSDLIQKGGWRVSIQFVDNFFFFFRLFFSLIECGFVYFGL
jgi:hypothetical protein